MSIAQGGSMTAWLALFSCSDPMTPKHDVEERKQEAHVPEPGPGTPESPAAPSEKPAPPAATSCNLEGKWTGTLPEGPQPWNGKPVSTEFAAGGALVATTPMGTRNASWELGADKVLVVSKSTSTGMGACKNEDVGHYQGTFGADCNTITFTKVDDTCAGREHGLVGYTLTRQ
jgi:hypothetical protein